jgi:hypothetical protein
MLNKQDHWDAELLRIKQGLDGCGCDICQELYLSGIINLEDYGSRVIHIGSVINIKAGEKGATIPIKPDIPQYNELETVSKMEPVESYRPSVENNYEMPKKRPGRPRKIDGLSATTIWRRQKEGVKG